MLRGFVTPTRPHGSVVVGSSRGDPDRRRVEQRRVDAVADERRGEGERAARVRHAADATCVKSPASIAGVGTNRTSSEGRSSVLVPW